VDPTLKAQHQEFNLVRDESTQSIWQSQPSHNANIPLAHSVNNLCYSSSTRLQLPIPSSSLPPSFPPPIPTPLLKLLKPRNPPIRTPLLPNNPPPKRPKLLQTLPPHKRTEHFPFHALAQTNMRIQFLGPGPRQSCSNQHQLHSNTRVGEIDVPCIPISVSPPTGPHFLSKYPSSSHPASKYALTRCVTHASNGAKESILSLCITRGPPSIMPLSPSSIMPKSGVDMKVGPLETSAQSSRS